MKSVLFKLSSEHGLQSDVFGRIDDVKIRIGFLLFGEEFHLIVETLIETFRFLSAMQAYCQVQKCRAQQLIAYFGQDSEPCGKCDVCAPVVLNDETLLTYLNQARTIADLMFHFACSKTTLEGLIRPHLLTEKIKFKAGKFYL